MTASFVRKSAGRGGRAFCLLQENLRPASAGSEAQRTAWFRQAKFGMFVHWGPYSLASVEASWPIMTPAPHWNITEAEYVALYKQFNPIQFDPQAWVRLAQDAGMRYMHSTHIDLYR